MEYLMRKAAWTACGALVMAQAVQWYRKAAEFGFGEAPPPPAGGQ